MAGKLPNKSKDFLDKCIVRSAQKDIKIGRGAVNTGDVSNGGKTTVAAGEKGAFNSGTNEKGVISVDSTKGNAPVYNIGNAIGGEINVRSSVPSGCGCCEIVVDESDDYISNLKVKRGDFKSGEGIYDMSKPNQRGLCIIFNIVKFPGDETLSDRCGSSYEARCLKKVHTELFCKVDVIHSDEEQNNCKYEDIINKLEETSKLSDNPYQALFVFFLSHGESNGLYCSDGKILEFNKPINMFNNNESTWKEIPKFFSFHCCRGSEFDYQNTDTSRPTPYAHTLINYSTQFGYVSWRHKESGSYFGKAYCLSVCEHACDKHLEEILNETFKKLKEYIKEKEEYKVVNGKRLQLVQQAEYTGHKFKKLYLNP